MALRKCPRCELNYITENEKICSVCRREAHGECEQYETIELCSECGENPVVPGKELCSECLKDLQRHAAGTADETVAREAATVGIDSVATMDEIELDLPDELEDDGFEDDDDEKDEDDDDFEDDDENED